MIPQFGNPEDSLVIARDGPSNGEQLPGWFYFNVTAPGLNGGFRCLPATNCQVTVWRSWMSDPAQINVGFLSTRKKLLLALSTTVTVESNHDKPFALHDRSARMFSEEVLDLNIRFPLTGHALLVFIEFNDERFPAVSPPGTIENRPCILTTETLDLMATLILDPLVGHRPVLADEIAGALLKKFSGSMQEQQVEQPVSTVAEASWFYREKMKLVTRALFIASTDETIQSAALENEARFRMLLKRFYGYTVLEFITEVRMAEAVRQLKNPEKTIKYIARYTGFRSTNYFTRSFRKYFGITPKRFRDMQG